MYMPTIEFSVSDISEMLHINHMKMMKFFYELSYVYKIYVLALNLRFAWFYHFLKWEYILQGLWTASKGHGLLSLDSFFAHWGSVLSLHTTCKSNGMIHYSTIIA